MIRTYSTKRPLAHSAAKRLAKRRSERTKQTTHSTINTHTQKYPETKKQHAKDQPRHSRGIRARFRGKPAGKDLQAGTRVTRHIKCAKKEILHLDSCSSGMLDTLGMVCFSSPSDFSSMSGLPAGSDWRAAGEQLASRILRSRRKRKCLRVACAGRSSQDK
jgi:hypothetical protein